MKLNQHLKRQLVAKYTDTTFPGSFGPLRLFYDNLASTPLSHLTYGQVNSVLREQINSFTTNARRRVRFPRRVYNLAYQGQLWEADVFYFTRDLQRSTGTQGGLLIVIDVFSHLILTIEPLGRQKDGKKMAKVLRKVLENARYAPTILATDQGREFCNHQ